MYCYASQCATEMTKIENLQAKSRNLHCLLMQYSVIDGDADMVLKFMTPLFEQIAKGEVIPPKEFIYRWYFGSTDSPLAAFEDLINVAAEFSHVLEDWPTPIILVP
jgi:hypothetical protein